VSTLDTAAPAAFTPVETVTIRPPRGWRDIGLRELWAYRELLFFLAKREIQIRYKQSLFGIGWAVLQPLSLAFIFALFFGVVLKVEPPNGIPYTVFAIVGVVPWLFMSQTFSQTSLSLVQDAGLLSKVYFPRLAIPLAKSLSLLLDLAISLVLMVLVTLLYGVPISTMAWLVPAFLFLGVLTAFGLGTLFASINVKYRDVTLIVPMITQVMLFITPIAYPVSYITGDWKYLYAVNPMVSVIDGIRWALLDQPAPLPGTVAISVAVTVVLCTVAVLYFRRTEQYFADIV
jgi:lipopolysaccharide transport system permease protein